MVGLRMSLAEFEAHQRRMGRAIALPAPAKRPAKASAIEEQFAQQIEALGLPRPQRQFKGAVPVRKYRLDFCWPAPEYRAVVEVQGHAHRIRERFLADCEKVSLLTLAGWRVLLVSGDDVRSGRGARWLQTLLGQA